MFIHIYYNPLEKMGVVEPTRTGSSNASKKLMCICSKDRENFEIEKGLIKN